MAWTAPRTWVAAEILTAALLNTHLRDNLLETGPAKVTTQGDLLYATAANALARLAKGTADQQLRMNAGATAPEWATLLPAAGFYMGARAANRHVEAGTVTTDVNGYATITYANAFSVAPVLTLTLEQNDDNAGSVETWIKTISSTQATIACFLGATPQTSKVIHWIAEGAD